jgi:hypothetical protein
VIFNNLLTDQSLNINYNSGTGQFTILQAGNYYVTWWVATDGAAPATTVSFGLSLNGGGPIIGSSSIVSGQVNGSALIVVGATPATLELVNATGETVFIPATTVQANIVIVEVSV